MASSDVSNARASILDVLGRQVAHRTYERVVADWPVALRGAVPDGLVHSPWMVIEHLRIAQLDILAFSRGPGHDSPTWPDEYWPTSPQPPSATAWDESIAAFVDDLESMRRLLADESRELATPLTWGTGQSLLREGALLVDHNAYHLGELAAIRRLQGIGPAKLRG